MQLNRYVSSLGRELGSLADAAGDETRLAVERLTSALESAIHMTLLEALSDAAGEITRELAPGSVELRLRGRDPEFVVTAGPTTAHGAPAAEPNMTSTALPAAAPVDATGATGVTGDDGPAARINVRLPEQLKTAIETAAAAEGRSVNAWLVRAATAALSHPAGAPPTSAAGIRSKQRLSGWVR